VRQFIALLLSSILAARAVAAIDYDSGDDLRWSTAPVTAVPLTLHAHFLTDTVAAGTRTFVGLLNNGSANDAFAVDNVAATTRGYTGQAASWAVATCSGSVSASTWYNGTFVSPTASDRTIYRDGANSANNTTSKTPSGINGLYLGVASSNQLLGRLAEVAVWNTNLSTGEIAALGAGLCPKYVRADNLVFYQSGLTTTTAEIGGAPTTTTGSPTVVAHPTAVKYKNHLVTQ